MLLDTPAGDGTGGDPCAICEEAEFSYLWVANSPESTVSKINTRTMQEEGRYLTHPESNGNPSRTSVSIDGNAVADELVEIRHENHAVLQRDTQERDEAAYNVSENIHHVVAFAYRRRSERKKSRHSASMSAAVFPSKCFRISAR